MTDFAKLLKEVEDLREETRRKDEVISELKAKNIELDIKCTELKILCSKLQADVKNVKK